VTAVFSDEEFVGYLFQGSPERRPRLWFLDRHLEWVFLAGDWPIGDARRPIHDLDVGTWTLIPTEGYVYLRGHLRYEHRGVENWTAVWRLTDVTIPHVHTFGRDDDVWRLGLWPD
jgi:hypothetical protein